MAFFVQRVIRKMPEHLEDDGLGADVVDETLSDFDTNLKKKLIYKKS